MAYSAEEFIQEVRKLEAKLGEVSSDTEQSLEGLYGVTEEIAIRLGIPQKDTLEALESLNFAEQLLGLREQFTSSVEQFRDAIRASVGVASAAIVLGISSPAFAESETNFLELSQHGATEVRSERAPLPSYEVAKQHLREGVLTAEGEEAAVFVRTKDGGPMQTMILRKGKKVSVSFSEEESAAFTDAMKTKTAEIEMVHTHPISALKNLQLISEQEAEAMSQGEIEGASAEPSVADWQYLITDDDIYNFPPTQFSARVIDATGEWEYGISDSSSPFILGMRKISQAINTINFETIGLTPEEQTLLKQEVELNETAFHAMQKILHTSEVSFSNIRKKFFAVAGPLISNNLSDKDALMWNELTQPLSSQMSTEKRSERILRMKEIASILGFKLKYTPHVKKGDE